MNKLTATVMAATVALTSGAALAMDDKMKTMMHDNMKSKFEMMDSDKDGMISKAEYTSAKMKSFDEMDSNDDGMISMEEKKAFKMKMHDMMKKDMMDGDMKKMNHDKMGQGDMDHGKMGDMKNATHEQMHHKGDDKNVVER